MFRKLILGAVAAASLGLVAMAPTSASAWGGYHGGWHGYGFHHVWGGPRFIGGPVIVGGYSCVVRRWVPTPWGPRVRLVNRCY
jgi:hypothetical protein